MTKQHAQVQSLADRTDLLKRYGRQIYEINPSLSIDSIDRCSDRQIDKKAERFHESIEYTVENLPNLFSTDELNCDRFIKFYLEGIRQSARLNRPGANLLEFVCDRLSQKDFHNKDTICINYVLVNKWQPGLNRRTYSRGIAELLAKEFLFRSMVTDLYFINVRFIFNGDRDRLAETYSQTG
jgi:hypothetical protein